MKNSARETSEAAQLVTFRLGRETFGIDIFRIQEVIHFRDITTIPNAPEFVEGVIELRDRVIPVVDLKKRLMTQGESEGKRRIVVLDLDDRPLGVIVDDISKVLLLDSSDYEAVPESVVGDRERACITRLAKTGDGLVIIISPERILSRRESEALRDLDLSGGREEADAASSHGAA